jgi:hypothetical protein
MSNPARPNILGTSLRCLTHPLSWLAVALLLCNDHLFKVLMPSWLTGKLSDFAGLFFFPFVLAAIASLPLDRLRVSPHRAGGLTIVITGVCFTLIKIVPAINLLAGEVLSRAIGYRTVFVLDSTDVVALIMLLPAWRLWKQPAPNARGRAGWVALAIGAAASLASSPPSTQMGIVGVQASLPRFTLDCIHYQLFPSGQNDPIKTIEIAPDGKVWAGGNHAIARFDPSNESWQTFKLPEGNWYLRHISIGPDNIPWATIWSGKEPYPSQLLRFDGQGFQRASEVEAVITSTINHVAVAPDHSLWFATDDGAYRWDQANNQWQHYDPSSGWTGSRVWEIRFTPDGTIWLTHDTSTSYHALPIESSNTGNWKLRTTQEDTEPGNRTSYDKAYDARDGRIWFSGQRFFDPVHMQWVRTVNDDPADGQAIDSSGRLWLVQQFTDKKAVLIPNPVSSPREQWLYFGKAEGLTGDKIASVAIDGDDRLWFGSDYGAEAGSVSRCKPPGDRPNSTTLAAFAGYGSGSRTLTRFDSLDGGLTWSSQSVASYDGYSNPKVVVEPLPDLASLRDPDNDAIMYRITRGQSIERSADSGATWTTEVVLTPWTQAQEALYATRTGYYQTSSLPTAAEIDRPTGNLVLGMGLEGGLVRTPDGQWHRVKVGDYQHIEARGTAILFDAVSSSVLLLEFCAGIALACCLFGLALSAWGIKRKTLKSALVLSALGFGMPLFRGLYAGTFMDMSTYALCAQVALLILSGIGLVAASSQARSEQFHARFGIALAISILGMILYWLPFILWSQNIIPTRSVATIIAVVVSCVSLILQTTVSRRSGRKQPVIQ